MLTSSLSSSSVQAVILVFSHLLTFCFSIYFLASLFPLVFHLHLTSVILQSCHSSLIQDASFDERESLQEGQTENSCHLTATSRATSRATNSCRRRVGAKNGWNFIQANNILKLENQKEKEINDKKFKPFLSSKTGKETTKWALLKMTTQTTRMKHVGSKVNKQ